MCYNWLRLVTEVTTVNNSVTMETGKKLKIKLSAMLDFHFCEKSLKIFIQKRDIYLAWNFRDFCSGLIGSTVLSQRGYYVMAVGAFVGFAVLTAARK